MSENAAPTSPARPTTTVRRFLPRQTPAHRKAKRMHATSERTAVPRGNLQGLRTYLRNDLLAGFLVFLIALPLCLGISSACGFPPIAGVFTAIIGGIVTTFISDSELTIKGPAAGLIVIVIGCVQDFGGDGVFSGWRESDQQAYSMTLAVAVAAGAIQILFGLFRSGTLGEFFPTSTVHGMLAAIGVIIMAKQIPVILGVGNRGEPLELLLSLPEKFREMNPEIALIGGVSLAILFGLLRRIPAPMVVLLVAVPLGMYFDLTHEHTYTFGGHDYLLGEEYLVPVPDDLFSAVAFPDFSALRQPRAWKWVLMFALIGSLESLLSAKAIDSIDPFHRKTNLNRDLAAVGIGNMLAAAVGGLPMISEIVRSKANIDNGARTRFADLFHACFLLLFVASAPWLIHRIPLAALGAMLVYTGFRLASPREFANAYRVGREQFVIFTCTLVAVLATDLLIGVGIGIAVKFLSHLLNGAPLRSILHSDVSVEHRDASTFVVTVKESAVFLTWILLKKRLQGLTHGEEAPREVIVDLSETRLVDHTVMERLHELQQECHGSSCNLRITGLEGHRQLSRHPHAARVRQPRPLRDQSAVVGLTLTARDDGLIRYVAMVAGMGILKKVQFIHVVPERAGPLTADDERWDKLRATVQACFADAPAAIEVRSALVCGPVVDSILHAVAAEPTDLLFLGKQERADGRRTLARRLAMQAPCSLWVVPDGAAARLSRILVPIDFSDHAVAAMRLALALTRRAPAATCLPLHVYFADSALAPEACSQRLRGEREGEYRAFITRLNHHALDVQPAFTEGAQVSRTICAAAQAQAADLMVMAPRGRSRSAAVLLGSTTEDTLLEARTPLLIVRCAGKRSGLLRLLVERMLRARAVQCN